MNVFVQCIRSITACGVNKAPIYVYYAQCAWESIVILLCEEIKTASRWLQTLERETDQDGIVVRETAIVSVCVATTVSLFAANVLSLGCVQARTTCSPRLHAHKTRVYSSVVWCR